MGRPRNITVVMAARLMGKGVLFVREAMKQGYLDIGTAMQMPGSTRWTFHISPALLAAYMGVTTEQLWDMLDEITAKGA